MGMWPMTGQTETMRLNMEFLFLNWYSWWSELEAAEAHFMEQKVKSIHRKNSCVMTFWDHHWVLNPAIWEVWYTHALSVLCSNEEFLPSLPPFPPPSLLPFHHQAIYTSDSCYLKCNWLVKWDNNRTSAKELFWGLNNVIGIKCLVQYLA